MTIAIVTVNMQEDVKRWANETLATLGHAGLPVRIAWSKRFTSRLGDALYQDGCSRVRFSVPLWPRAGGKNQYETVVHEICHIVASHENVGRKISAHGREWKALMWKCDVEPRRCHDVRPAGYKDPRTIKAKCGCKEHMVTEGEALKIAAGFPLGCRKCRTGLTLCEPLAHASPPPKSPPSEEKKGLRFVRKNGRAFMRFT